MRGISTEAAGLAAKGTYLLLIRLDRDTEITVGRLGTFSFPAGGYAYAGSALGPGGLPARLARHRRAHKRTHWHIDYLLLHGTLEVTWQLEWAQRLECAWAQALLTLPSADIPVPGFGSSDCRCRAHLIHSAYRLRDEDLARVLRSVSPGDSLLHRMPGASSSQWLERRLLTAKEDPCQ